MQEIKDDVCAFITDRFLLGNANGLSSAQSLLDSGVMDSTGVMELVLFLEETYSVRVLDTELTPENLDSIDRIARFVSNKRRMATRPQP
jgi:acyl carrier protein